MTQAEYDKEWFQCQQEAINAGALEPQNMGERLAANWINYQGGFWRDSPRARARLDQWTRECMRRKGFSA